MLPDNCYICGKTTEDEYFDGEDYLPCCRGACHDGMDELLAMNAEALVDTESCA